MTGQNNNDGHHPDHHQHHNLNLHHDRKKHHTKTLPPPPDDVIDPEYNIFRDSLLRYMGYANEVGESFRYQFPGLVKPSYVVAFGYCLADAVTSGYQAYNNETLELSNENSDSDSDSDSSGSNSGTYAATTATTNDTRMFDATVACADTLLWQSMASVAIPGLVIHQIVKWSRVGIQNTMISQTKQPAFIMAWGPTMLGLASIPLIIKPIDFFVDELMDHTFRRIVPVSDDDSNCSSSGGK
mmetsp:Transcript_14483/g.35093  ORF Transcript_14483/g.35093 Transcript_14483/m.35093 type:complete len:241 (+) Transcript_14483:105-827(+)